MPIPSLPGPVSLPITPAVPPKVRIVYRDDFGSVDASPDQSSGYWTELDYLGTGSNVYGAELLSYKRVCLPDIGTAEFRYVYGSFPELLPGTYQRTAPDLNKKEIKIQMRPLATDPWKTVFWGTVYEQEDETFPGGGGSVDGFGNTYRGGARIYRLMDGLWRTSKWMMSQSGFISASKTGGTTPTTITKKYFPVYSNPGYNYIESTVGTLFGNKHPSETYTYKGVEIPFHVWQGAYSFGGSNPFIAENKWKETEMVKHACAANRPPGEPMFELKNGGKDNFEYATAQQVRPDMSVLDFLSKILSRRRGLAAVWVDWTDSDDSIFVFLNSTPLRYDSMTYTAPTSGATSETIIGAYAATRVYGGNGTLQVWNLIGDHRNVDQMYKQSDPSVNIHDFVETIGEKIEVTATLSLYDTALDVEDDWYSAATAMEPRYSSKDVKDYTDLIIKDRLCLRSYRHVFNLFGLSRSWEGKTGNGFNEYIQRVDYRCGDGGEVFVPTVGSTPIDTPPGYVELSGTLPFYEGWSYKGTKPQRSDGADEYGLPSRRSAQIFLRPNGVNASDADLTVAGTDKWYYPSGQWASTFTDKFFGQGTSGGPLTPYQPTVTIAPDAIMLDSQQQTEIGARLIGDPKADKLRNIDKKLFAIFPASRLAITLALVMPYRIRFCTSLNAAGTGPIATPTGYTNMADRSLAKRTKTIYVPGLHLWLASSNAIWDLKQSTYTNNKGFDPYRNCLQSTPTAPAVIRDDRWLLNRYHILASTWYTTPRRKLVVAQRFCAEFPYQDAASTFSSPKIGNYIYYCAADGVVGLVNTIVTSFEYNHQSNTTTWITDYFDLEMSL